MAAFFFWVEDGKGSNFCGWRKITVALITRVDLEILLLPPPTHLKKMVGRRDRRTFLVRRGGKTVSLL